MHRLISHSVSVSLVSIGSDASTDGRANGLLEHITRASADQHAAFPALSQFQTNEELLSDQLSLTVTLYYHGGCVFAHVIPMKVK